MTYWYRGQKVVCVDDRPLYGTKLKPLQKGMVYTVEDEGLADQPVSTPEGTKIDDAHLLILEEVKNPIKVMKNFPGFSSVRFRPLDDSRLDVFRSYLNKSEEENRRELKVSERNKKLEDA